MARRFRRRWNARARAANSGGEYKYGIVIPLPTTRPHTMFSKSIRAALISLASLAAAAPAEKRQDAGPHTGRATFYRVGLGVCGFANQPSDFVVALSPGFLDAFPGATPGDPFNNPICGRQARVTYNQKFIIVSIVDECPSCALYGMDLSTSAFQALAGDLNVGLIEVTWEIIGP